jgi:hypothetical protein
MRGVIAHLGMMERVMTGWLPESADVRPPLDRIDPYHDEMAALDDAAFAGRIGEIFASRRADLAGLTEADLARPTWTPIGTRSYGGFLEMRIFDFWVHERDIAAPLGWPTDDTGPRTEISLAQVEGSIGYIVGKKIGLPDGASIVFHLTGPVKRDLAVVVDGRARAVGHVEHPDVELTTDTVTFVQLAAGRIDPQRQIDAGLVTWTGNAQRGTAQPATWASPSELAGVVAGCRQERPRLVHGVGERDPAVHPGQPQQLAGLRPGTDRMQAAAAHVGAAGHPDQGPEPGRINEADTVKVDDQRLPAVRQPEQALPQTGHRGHVDIPGDLRDHDAAITTDRDRQLITHGHPPAAHRHARPSRLPDLRDHSRIGPGLRPVLPASAPFMRATLVRVRSIPRWLRREINKKDS